MTAFRREPRSAEDIELFETFMYAFEAVAPVVLIIFLGFFFKKIGMFSDEFISKGYSFSFRIALPCMLFCNVYSIKSIGDIDWRTVIYALIMTVVLFLIASATVLLFVGDKRRRGVVVQCFFRSNCAIVGVSLTEALGGLEALSSVSVITAFTIPLYNMLAVVALTAFNSDGKEGKRGLAAIDWKRIGKKIVTNPLIIGVFLGLFCLGIRSFIPVDATGEKVFMLSRELKVVYTVIENVGRIASPFMLLIMGAQFTFAAVKSRKREIVIGTLGRIVISPCLAIGLGYLLTLFGVLSLGKPEYAAFIAVFASPVAVSTAIMAREMDNDDILAGQLVVWTSIGSVFTIFLIAMFFRTVGLL